MPGPRNWASPPTRREVTLLIFSLTVFVLSYNLETSLRMAGVSPAKLANSRYLSAVISDPGFERDGRRPTAWRDDLENLIAGEWTWEEGQIAGVERGEVGLVGAGTSQKTIYNVGHKKAGRSATREDPGVGTTKGTTVNEQFTRWEKDIPKTTAIAHVPGYTILDNVFILNGTFFLVTEDPLSLPRLGAIASSGLNPGHPPRLQDWRILTPEEATVILGPFGGHIKHVTWLSTEPANAQDPYTLFSLFRTHSYLATSHQSTTISSSGLRVISPDSTNSDLGSGSVPPPVRLWFPRIPTFAGPHVPVDNAHPLPRARSYNGLHPMLLKAAFPTIEVMYSEDWQDFADMQLPYVLERVVIADRGAAERNSADWTSKWAPAPSRAGASDELRKRQGAEDGLPAWAAPFVGFDVPEDWWAPVRAALLSYLGLPTEPEQKEKPVVTFVSMQEEPYEAGAHIRTEDHPELVDGLQKLQREGVISELHIVRANGTKENWDERMRAITRSDIMLGAFGPNLADSLFMHASGATSQAGTPAPLLMEFYPSGTFLKDREFSARTLGMRYMAWWEARKFSGASLPPVMGLRNGQSQWVTVDASAVLQEIRAEARRFST
ncbi:uncharacterized protein PHACADRAFT_251949 [Phanerochaete carnosa HHB-10118-sp]|uniref:Uncharacterized protein n=1 Tax=Phanerochaete carnosa (strain HHB-10118-sp) TaxID=650164 RepID=K5V5P8_PHACS|nr:uncharacterized protein PHACADRAFT_251949 [Phanerochaete carnosa HHB-10118-sp]EKM58001.1 hypothetical protein PHACADRAFT_251949 [Phanerochaete carnosa HHB-10118-sp]